MKVVVLTTHTNNTPILYSALSATRNVSVIVYDRMASFESLSGQVEQLNPDWVLYIGAIPYHHRLPVPMIDDLRAISYKKVLLCCDGADDAWWPLLEEYNSNHVFDLNVNIDGVADGPVLGHGDRWITTVAPIDPSGFGKPIPWSERQVFAGFAGLIMGGERSETIRALAQRGLVDHRQRDGHQSPSNYINWTRNCQVIWNHPETGGTKSQHVKARVIEAALSGCLVLEKDGSPLMDWFEPDEDYLTWSSVDDVEQKLMWVHNNLAEAEAMAQRMRAKALTKYNVEAFWQRVERRLGVRNLECVA